MTDPGSNSNFDFASIELFRFITASFAAIACSKSPKRLEIDEVKEVFSRNEKRPNQMIEPSIPPCQRQIGKNVGVFVDHAAR